MKSNYNNFWTKEELAILRQGIAEGWHVYQIKQQLPNRQYLGIITKAREISGMADSEPVDERRSRFDDQRVAIKEVYSNHDKPWLPHEVQILEDSFKSGKSFVYIAQRLDRAVSSCMRKLYKLHSDNTTQINKLFQMAVRPEQKD